MGALLMSIYDEIAKEGQITAKTNLAQITKIPSIKAALAPDSPENLKSFKEAFKKITGKDCPLG
jgi:hypothetical protein